MFVILYEKRKLKFCVQLFIYEYFVVTLVCFNNKLDIIALRHLRMTAINVLHFLPKWESNQQMINTTWEYGSPQYIHQKCDQPASMEMTVHMLIRVLLCIEALMMDNSLPQNYTLLLFARKCNNRTLQNKQLNSEWSLSRNHPGMSLQRGFSLIPRP